MNPEAQRIAIAEACGWRCVADFKSALACWVRSGNEDWQTEWIPDYLNDLNAIHVAEDVLFSRGYGLDNYRELDEYKSLLDEMTSGDAFYATAEQRSRAFLKALNLWTYD